MTRAERIARVAAGNVKLAEKLANDPAVQTSDCAAQKKALVAATEGPQASMAPAFKKLADLLGVQEGAAIKAATQDVMKLMKNVHAARMKAAAQAMSATCKSNKSARRRAMTHIVMRSLSNNNALLGGGRSATGDSRRVSRYSCSAVP